MQRPLRAAERGPQPRVRHRVRVIAIDVLQLLRQARERVRVDTAVRGEAVVHAFAQPVDAPARACDADHRQVEAGVPHHRLQRGEDLLVCEVTGDAEDHQRVAVRPHRRSTCPPNAWRIAESTLSAYSEWPRETKRPNSAALSTGTGTPSAIADSTVQRPSPESATRPA